MRLPALAWFGFLLALVVHAGFGGRAQARDFPSQPIRLIVPFAPGGTTDIIARVIAEPLSQRLGQKVVVENRGGGGSVVGALELVQAEPDGHVLAMATVSMTASNPAANPKIPYNPLVDFSAITNIAATPNVIAVHPSFPARDYAAFLALLQKHPGKYAYASSGAGGIGHLQMELYKSLSGTTIRHVPYRGAGPALSDVIAGQVPVLFDNLPSTLPHIQAGRLVPIVVAAPERLAALPHVPTFAEVGLEPVNRMAYYGIVGPRKLPRVLVHRIHDAVITVLEQAEVRQRIEDTGAVLVGNTPSEFAAQIEAEFEVYRKVVTDQRLSLE